MVEYQEEFSVLSGIVPDVMGTRLLILLHGSGEQTERSVFGRMADEARRLGAMLNRFDPDSDVYRLNVNTDSGWQSVNDDLVDILRICKEYHARTIGLFDVTKGSRAAYETRPGGVNLYGTEIDLGGFAKGFFLERSACMIKEAGIPGALVCFGQSSTLAVGSHPCGDGWKVAVSSPFGNIPLTEVELKDSSLSVSGNRPGYDEHLFDPHTGRCYRGRKAAVVVSDSPLDAEVLSTAAIIASDSELDMIRRGFADATVNIYE